MQMIVPPNQVFGNTKADQGEGSLLALKLVLQAFSDKKFYIVFSSSLSANAKYLNYPSLVTNHPLAAGRSLSRSSKEHVLVFAGDVITSKNLKSFTNVQENLTYICLNNAGSSSSRSRLLLEKLLCMDITARYKATASIAFPEDLMKKLLRSKSEPGLSFIEIHCPSPCLWGFDPSNTIEVSRVAVNSNIWPLLEFPSGKQTYLPEQLESFENYLKIQSRFTEKDMEKIRNRVLENTKLISELQK